MLGMNNNENVIYKTMWMAIMRCIWDHRNNVLFRNAIIDGNEIFGTAQLKA